MKLPLILSALVLNMLFLSSAQADQNWDSFRSRMVSAFGNGYTFGNTKTFPGKASDSSECSLKVEQLSDSLPDVLMLLTDSKGKQYMFGASSLFISASSAPVGSPNASASTSFKHNGEPATESISFQNLKDAGYAGASVSITDSIAGGSSSCTLSARAPSDVN
jgi:hypothetical protein